MSPDFRKVALVAASLGLLVSLFVALSPRGDDSAPSATTVATSRTSTAPAATAPKPAGGQRGPGIHIDYTVSDGRPRGGIARDSILLGRIVVMRITSDIADEVHLHGYDLTAAVGPGAPATIRFTADTPGRFELELEEHGLQIGELEVRP